MSAATSPTVLLVEDDLDVLDAMRVILHLEGYDVRCAENGTQALAMLAEGLVPMVVITDMMMPDLTGGDVMAAMRNHPLLCNVPVVLTTAACELFAPKGAFVLYKPFSVEDLVAAVAAVSRQSRDSHTEGLPSIPPDGTAKVSAA